MSDTLLDSLFHTSKVLDILSYHFSFEFDKNCIWVMAWHFKLKSEKGSSAYFLPKYSIGLAMHIAFVRLLKY